MNERTAPSRYLLKLGLTVLTALATITFFCAAVDPYGVIGTPGIAGLTMDKPAAAARPRLSKPYRMEQAKPATLLVGSSVLNVGIDPARHTWPVELRSAYNYGIDGASLEVQQAFLSHALATASPRLVMFFVSFEDTNVGPEQWLGLDAGQDQYSGRLRVLADGRPNPEYPWARLKDLAFSTLSYNAIGASFITLRSQGDEHVDQQTQTGFDTRARFNEWQATAGRDSMVQASLEQRTRDYMAWHATPISQMGALRSMIVSARKKGADVVIVVPPIYVAGLELRRQQGLDRKADDWLQDLVATAESAAAETGGKDHVATWDFATYNAWTEEESSSFGNVAADHPHWFYEAIHFRPELGELLMQRVLDGVGPDAFGQRLSSGNVNQVIRSFHLLQDLWVRNNPSMSAEVATVVRRVRELTCGRRPELCKSPGSLASLAAVP